MSKRSIVTALIMTFSLGVVIVAWNTGTAASHSSLTGPAVRRPEPSATPATVPGTTVQGRTASTKPGYIFNQKGRTTAYVEKTDRNVMVGTYVCIPPPGQTSGPGCFFDFAPHQITCRGKASGGGFCILATSPSVMQSPD